MKFHKTSIEDVYIIEMEPIPDTRGFFARSWCKKEFRDHGLSFEVIQCNISFNKKKGTIRGLHYQIPPHEEAKLVQCIKGSLFDVVIDLRPDSPTYTHWQSFDLNSSDNRILYIPAGLAHGFQTREDDTEIFYMMSSDYSAECARGIRWNDSFFSIPWPIPEAILSERDRQLPGFEK